MDFTRQLGSVAKEDSFLINEHPQVLEDFADIIGGQYVVGSNDTLYFKPAGARRRLAMDESSSAVRSLLDVGFYLRHVARRGDLLMMDEPELNLHPENQRRIARLFARLINLGVRVFVTTHSDYIVKELNTLIMLNPDRPGLRRIAEREGYQAEELISADKVRVYVAERAPTKLRHSTSLAEGPSAINDVSSFHVRIVSAERTGAVIFRKDTDSGTYRPAERYRGPEF